MRAIVAVTYLVEIETSTPRGLARAVDDFKAGDEINIIRASYEATQRERPERVEVRMQTCDELRKCSECGVRSRGLRKIKDAGNQTHYMHAKCWREISSWLRGMETKRKGDANDR